MTDRMDAMDLDEFWREYAEGCAELEGVQTVDKVIEICKRRWGVSSNDAFFPGGSGDQELLSILLDAGWRPVWIEASYYFAIRQPRDVCQVCHEKIELKELDTTAIWVHSHADKDSYCGCGDGSTAPPSTDGLTYIEGDIARGIQKRVPSS